MRRKDVAYLTPWGWGKGFSHLDVPLGSKNDTETKSEKQTKLLSKVGKEQKVHPLKPVPGCAKGLF